MAHSTVRVGLQPADGPGMLGHVADQAAGDSPPACVITTASPLVEAAVDGARAGGQQASCRAAPRAAPASTVSVRPAGEAGDPGLVRGAVTVDTVAAPSSTARSGEGRAQRDDGGAAGVLAMRAASSLRHAAVYPAGVGAPAMASISGPGRRGHQPGGGVAAGSAV